MSKVLGYKLLLHQKDHVKRIVETLAKNKSIVDLSLMGRGKTYTTCYSSCVLKSIMIVVCPASVESKWREMREKYNAPVWKVISYESLRGMNNKQPKHGLLKRNDKVSKSGNHSTSFCVSKSLSEITENRRVLFVFDEVQKTKNKSATAKACISLVSHACNREKSRVILLSGTPVDKKEQSINILRMMGLVTSNVLVRTEPDTGIVNWVGFSRLYKTCIEKDEDRTLRIKDDYNMNKIKDFPKFSYDLFVEVVLKHLSSKMPGDDISKNLDIRNRYFMCTDDEKIKLNQQIGKMSFFTNEYLNGSGETKLNIMSNIQKCLVQIENTKVSMIVRNARKVLTSSTNTKVCIMVNFTSTLVQLKEKLQDYDPIVVNGQVPKEKRYDLLKPFQENNDDMRLIIANMDVLSTGIDLDDKYGKFPRYVFASPNYKTMVIQQMTYRFLRADTKSDTTIDFVYGDCNTEESSILGCLSKKACVMRDCCLDGENAKVKYPDEFRKFIG